MLTWPVGGVVLVSFVLVSARLRSSCHRKKRSREFWETSLSLRMVIMPCSSANALAPSPTRALGGTRRRLRGILLVSRINFAKEIGFLISVHEPVRSQDLKSTDLVQLTWDSSTGTTSAEVIHDCGITLNSSVNGQIRAVTRIRNLFVFENSQGCFDGLCSSSAGFQKLHSHFSSPRCEILSATLKQDEWAEQGV